jgi:hypothetical protein
LQPLSLNLEPTHPGRPGSERIENENQKPRSHKPFIILSGDTLRSVDRSKPDSFMTPMADFGIIRWKKKTPCSCPEKQQTKEKNADEMI